MSQTLKSMPSIERALLLLLEDGLEIPDGQIGGDFAFDAETMPWFVRLERAGGPTDQIQGWPTVDVEVFGSDYDEVESVALAVEAFILGYPRSVMVDDRKVVFDYVEQNVGPQGLPWEDEGVYRLGATYVITLRRN